MPAGMGLLMGAMALYMLHGLQTGAGAAPGWLFVLGHMAVFAVGLGAVALGLHLRFAMLGRVLAHRPSARHIAVMFASASITASVIDLVHGGPTWT